MNRATQRQRLRLPAFARPLADLRSNGHRPDSETVVVRLDTWPSKRHVGLNNELCEGRAPQVRWPQVTVPSDSAPESLNFDFVRDLDVIVPHWREHSAPSRLRSLLRQILTSDPRRLIVLDMQFKKAWFVKSVERGVEARL